MGPVHGGGGGGGPHTVLPRFARIPSSPKKSRSAVGGGGGGTLALFNAYAQSRTDLPSQGKG